jgi:uncharacterized protein (TIGR03435 family)
VGKLNLVFVAAMAIYAQSQSFEVASIKANKVRNADGSFRMSPERLSAHNTFLGVLIMRAYQIDQSQFSKVSEPLLERYDVDARTDRPGHPR